MTTDLLIGKKGKDILKQRGIQYKIVPFRDIIVILQPSLNKKKKKITKRQFYHKCKCFYHVKEIDIQLFGNFILVF